VNSPSYYMLGKYEVADVIEEWDLGWHRGDAVAYIARAGRKNEDTEIQDLQKAAWHLNREIAMLQDRAKPLIP